MAKGQVLTELHLKPKQYRYRKILKTSLYWRIYISLELFRTSELLILFDAPQSLFVRCIIQTRFVLHLCVKSYYYFVFISSAVFEENVEVLS